jgi:tryptophan-rich sensory protein
MGGSPIENNWYQELPKAPWTPPGWVFGFAWTVVMITFSIFLSCQGKLTSWTNQYKLLYLSQWLLNATWNYVFFQFHAVGVALIILILLFFVLYFIWKNNSSESYTWTIAPYFAWLFVAISLNSYPIIHDYITFV